MSFADEKWGSLQDSGCGCVAELKRRLQHHPFNPIYHLAGYSNATKSCNVCLHLSHLSQFSLTMKN